jgi:hypothetical protein
MERTVKRCTEYCNGVDRKTYKRSLNRGCEALSENICLE